MPTASQNNLTSTIQFGGCAFLIAWFLLFFSGEIWGIDYEPAAELVVTLSLVSIASCFVTLIVLNALTRSHKGLAKAGGIRFVVLGVVLMAGTAGITFGHEVAQPLFIISCIAVGLSGAFFICATIIQLSRLAPRSILITCGSVFLVGILIYSFAFYVPGELTTLILCLLPLLASFFYVFDTPVKSGEGSGELSQPEEPETFTAQSQDAEISAQNATPLGWRTLILFSIFMMFSCVVRGYLPFYIDNEFFSYLRSFSIVGMLVMAAVAVIVPALLPEKKGLSNLYRGVYILGVVLFALFPIFGMDNPVALILEDGFRGLCALITLSYFACMARQRPFFGFKNVGGGLALYIAFGFIGWFVGLLLHDLSLSGDVLRICSSVQCVIVLLAFILLFRQTEIEQYLDVEPDEEPRVASSPEQVGEEGHPERSDQAVFSEKESGSGRWRQHMEVIATEKGLTAREQEIFILLAKGFKAQNISERLSISYNTTRAHIRNIYQKCDVHSQQEFIDLINESE